MDVFLSTSPLYLLQLETHFDLSDTLYIIIIIFFMEKGPGHD